MPPERRLIYALINSDTNLNYRRSSYHSSRIPTSTTRPFTSRCLYPGVAFLRLFILAEHTLSQDVLPRGHLAIRQTLSAFGSFPKAGPQHYAAGFLAAGAKRASAAITSWSAIWVKSS
jgi:hypothetical protein